MQTMIAEDGTAIHYTSMGNPDSQPIIFLHGWTARSTEWLPFAQTLADNYHVFCWDARGHNTHPVDTTLDTDIARMAEDLQTLIKLHSLNKVILVGHSMGALTAWEYIRHFGTSSLSSLCIIDQSPKLVTDESWTHGIYSNFCQAKREAFQQRLTNDFSEAVLELVAFGHNTRSRENYLSNSQGFQQMREYLKGLAADPLSRCWNSLTERDYRPLLKEIDIPTLLIYGDQSQFYSKELAHWVADEIPHTQLHIYPKSDHSPHLWHKQRFIDDLTLFNQEP